MSKIRNVVKVMNFHSLLRVDSAKKQADKYMMLEHEITSMIDIILNNKNFLLDKRITKPDDKKPVLTIYLGSDYGFCNNYNSLVNDYLRKDVDEYKIVMGKKMLKSATNVVMQIKREDFDKDPTEVFEYIKECILNLTYSEIHVVYNHYYSVSDIRIEKAKIYPVEVAANKDITSHGEDFMYEGDINNILQKLFALYIDYRIRVCDVNTKAAENIMRQNATNESLKKIDEREQVVVRERIKAKRSKEFRKVIEMHAKQMPRG